MSISSRVALIPAADVSSSDAPLAVRPMRNTPSRRAAGNRIAQYRLALPVTILAMTAMTSASQAQSLPAVESEGAETPGLADIVVTARRRSESAQRVPVSVTAVGDEALRANAITTGKDLQQLAPSLNVNTGNSRDVDRFTIRGQGTTSGAAPGVVAYFAEVPIPSNGGGPGIYNDLESVQILNGPQGTLFGRNTTGGAVLFTPKKPVNAFEGFGEVAYGNYANRQIQGAVNVPVVNDAVLLRVAGDYRRRDGFTEDVVSGAKYDNMRYEAFRASLTLKPTSTIESYFLLNYVNSHNSATGYKLLAFNPAATFTNLIGQARLDLIADEQASWGPRRTALSQAPEFIVKMYGVTNNTQITVSDQLTLKNIASYYLYRNKAEYDQDGTSLILTDVIVPTGRGAVSGSGSPAADNDYYTEELQLAWRSLNGMANFVLGAYLDGTDPREPSTYVLGTTNAAGVRYAVTSVAETSDSRAVYAQATVDVGAVAEALAGLKLTGGYRYTRDHKRNVSAGYRVSNPQDIASGGACSSVAGAIYPNCTKQAEATFTAGTYTFSADYRVSPSLLVYATARSGFKSGGFNANAPVGDPRAAYDPENVSDVELGFKSDFKLGSVPVRLNLDAFRINYKNIQRTTTQLINATPVTITTNAADARVKGFDVELSVRPVSALQLSGGYSYLEGSYYRSVAGAGGVANLNGRRLPYLPPHKATATAAYDSGPVTLTAAVSYSARFRASDLDYPAVELGGYTLVNAGILWTEPFDLPIDLRLTANNIFDTEYRIAAPQIYTTSGVASAAYGEPRMVVASLRYSFR